VITIDKLEPTSAPQRPRAAHVPEQRLVPRIATALVLLAAAAGCSFMIDTGNDENRPCKNGQCLAGYYCQNEVCVKGSPPGLDAGQPDAATLPPQLLPPGHSGLTPIGPRSAAAGSVQVSREGLSTSSRTCAGSTCVTGGIVP
jgi:hypothetical protein